MNIAIIHSVSTYDSHSALPGCLNDFKAMQCIIESSEMFDKKLYLLNRNSEESKVELAQLIKDCLGEKIEQILYYYSGHGVENADDFKYMFTNTSAKKMEQTTLSNNEFDDMLRSLNPEIVVKIVDACYSGVDYIKSDDAESGALLLKKSSSYKNCYFLYSSQYDQASRASTKISVFTESIVRSILETESKQIRYKDIIDFVSDDFNNHKMQNPRFIIQANHTEIFIDDANEARKGLRSLLPELSTEENKESLEAPSQPSLDLFSLIENEAKGYISQEECNSILEGLRLHIENYSIEEKFSQLYSLLFKFGSEKFVNPDMIGRWLSKNRGDLFAEAKTPRADEKWSMAYLARSLEPFGKPLDKKQFDYDYVLTGETMYSSIRIELNPLRENLHKYSVDILIIVSKTRLRIFYTFGKSEAVSWTWHKPQNTTSNTFEVLFLHKDKITTYFDTIYTRLINSIKQDLSDRYKISIDDISI